MRGKKVKINRETKSLIKSLFSHRKKLRERLYITTPNWKESQCPSTGERIRRHWLICTMELLTGNDQELLM